MREVDIVLVDDLLTLRVGNSFTIVSSDERDLPHTTVLSQTPPRDWIERKTERAKDRRGPGGGKSALTPRSMSPTPRNVPTCLHSGSLAYSFWTTGSRQVCFKKTRQQETVSHAADE